MATDMDWTKSRRERSVEMREQDDSPDQKRWVGSYDDMEEDDLEKSRESSKHRNKDRSKSSSRREDKDRSKDRSKNSHGSKDRDKEGKDLEKDRISGRDRRKEDREEQEKEKTREKPREKDTERSKHKDKDRDRDRKDRAKEKEREWERELDRDSERGRDKERGKDKGRDKEKDREKDRDVAKDREREREREKHKDKENDRERSRRPREKEKETDQDKERLKDKEINSHKQQRDVGHERTKDLRKDEWSQVDSEDVGVAKQGRGAIDAEVEDENLGHQETAEGETIQSSHSTLELEKRILKMKEERLKKPEGTSDVLAWVNRSRKLEEKRNAEREKALQLSKIFEEQDNMNQGESDGEVATLNTKHDLSGVKVLHGVDKVLEGGAVVLTLKDQSILADGDLNEEGDVLENVEIGEQKRRDEAYKASKRKAGYDDKFDDEPGAERKVLPQYDDPISDEGMTLDASGHFTGEAEKKLEELRRRIQGVPTIKNFEDLHAPGKMASDYFTEEEMVKFKKPRKKKSLRKKEKVDYDSLEAEAKSAGLGTGDLGSRNDGKRQALKEEQERNEAQMRNDAYQAAVAKAGEASKALRLGQNHNIQAEEDEAPAIGDDDEELQKSLQRARKLALQKQGESVKSGPLAIALLAASAGTDLATDNQNFEVAESQENKIVFTEMDEFVWGLQFDEETQKPEAEDVFMEEDVPPNNSNQERNEEDGGWSELKESEKDGIPEDKEEEIVPDETIHEITVGKGLSGALKLLKERGSLKESVEWGGRNMDKKKSKLVGIYDDEGQKEIRIERTDEYGRTLTPKEAFRLLSHKFHGKGPGKMKQEKRMRQYLEELKVKQMKNADTPSLSVERMREAQAQLKTPYLVLSGHVKPGQTSDPRSGFATVEKDLPGGLTPMLGDKKVEYFLGKRKFEVGDTPQKKPKN